MRSIGVLIVCCAALLVAALPASAEHRYFGGWSQGRYPQQHWQMPPHFSSPQPWQPHQQYWREPPRNFSWHFEQPYGYHQPRFAQPPLIFSEPQYPFYGGPGYDYGAEDNVEDALSASGDIYCQTTTGTFLHWGSCYYGPEDYQ
jgi:hypothetical protein